MSMPDGYAATLPVAERAVTVVGAGGSALGHVAALRDANARVTVVAPEALASIADLAARRVVNWRRDAYRPSDLDDAWLVVAATGDEATDGQVAKDAAERRIWCVTAAVRGARKPGVPGVGSVVLVGGGPGDPGLLTVAGLQALREADVVVTDRLAPLAALTELRDGAEVIDVAKIPRGRNTPQAETNRLLVEHAQAGRRVVRLKGGDSFVFGRGGEELQACAAAGIDVQVIPGVTSALAGPAMARIPLTHRGLNQGFTVVSGHVPPGDPRSTVDYAALARSGTDLVLLMAVATLPAIARALLGAGLDPATPAATIADATLPTQQVVRADVATIAARVADAGIGSPAITVIGSVARFDPLELESPG